MMEHEGLPVHGYRPQPQDAIDRVNQNKKLEEWVLRIIDEHGKVVEYDKRWIAIAKTHIEQGFMALNRAVFQPQRVELSKNAFINFGD